MSDERERMIGILDLAIDLAEYHADACDLADALIAAGFGDLSQGRRETVARARNALKKIATDTASNERIRVPCRPQTANRDQNQVIDCKANPVEIMCRAQAKKRGFVAWEVLLDNDQVMWMATMRELVTALEAQGFHIVGPEPTEEMLSAGESCRWLSETWAAMLAAAPTYGSAT